MLNLLGVAPFFIKGIIDYKRLENERQHIKKQQDLQEQQNKEQEKEFKEYKNYMKKLAVSSAKANMANRGINLTSLMARQSLKSAGYNIDRELANFEKQQNLKTDIRNNHYKNLLDQNFYKTLHLPFNW